MDSAFLKKLTEIVEVHLSDPQFGVDELAREMGQSYSSLRRKVSTNTGKSANQLIKEIRLRKAFDILQQEDVTTAEVAYRTGFNSPNYFNSCFHDFFGYPPGELRKLGQMSQKDNNVLRKRRVVSCNRIRRVFLLTGVLVVLVIAATLLIKVIDRNPGRWKSIAVLPVRSLDKHPETVRFCGGLQEQLLNELKRMETFEVRSRISTDKYKNPDRSITDIGEELNADFIIDITVSRDVDLYNVWFRLYDAKMDIIRWSDNIARHTENLFELQEWVVNTITSELRSDLLTEKRGTGELATSKNPEAEKFCTQGQFFSDLLNFKPDRALECYANAVRLDPGLTRAHLGIAFILNNLYPDLEKRHDSMPVEIIQDIERVLDLQPGLPEAYEQRGLMHHVTGDFGKALGACSLALQKNPGSPETLDIMAMSFLSLGNGTRAEDCINQALHKKPYTAGYLVRLGNIQDHLRNYPNAAKHYREANGVNPLMSAAIYGRVDISIKTGGDPARSRELLDTLVAQAYLRGADSLSLYYQYAILDLFERKYLQAVNRFSGWPRVLPQGPPYYIRPKYMMCALAYGLMKKPEMERKYYDSTRLFLEGLQEASIANRDDPRVMSALGIAFAGLGFPDKAIACAEKVAELLKAKPDAWIEPFAMEDVAFIYTITRKYATALKILRKLLSNPGPLTIQILELDPRWAPLRNLLEYKKMKQEF